MNIAEDCRLVGVNLFLGQDPHYKFHIVVKYVESDTIVKTVYNKMRTSEISVNNFTVVIILGAFVTTTIIKLI